MSVEISSVAISPELKKIDLECGDHNRSTNMTWVINEFLMNCGEQPIINNYLDCLPEEILQIIYRFINEANIKLLSVPDGWGNTFVSAPDFCYHTHTNGMTYMFNIKEEDHRIVLDDKFQICGGRRGKYSYNWRPECYHIDKVIEEDQVLINGYKIKKFLYGLRGTNMNSKSHISYWRSNGQQNEVEAFCREYPKFESYKYKGVSFKLQGVFTYWITKGIWKSPDMKEYFEIVLRYESNEFTIFKNIYILPQNTRAKKNCVNLEDYSVRFATNDGLSWKAISQD